MTNEELAVQLKVLFAPWPHIELTPALIMSFKVVMAGENFSTEELEAAVKSLLGSRNKKTISPLPADLLSELKTARRLLSPPVPRYSRESDYPEIESYHVDFEGEDGRAHTRTYLRANRAAMRDFIDSRVAAGKVCLRQGNGLFFCDPDMAGWFEQDGAIRVRG